MNMFRRRFIESFTLATALNGTLTAAAGTKTVKYKINGFTCITCAAGLDAILKQQAGVVDCKSTYYDAITVIQFNPSLVNERLLRSSISDMGFTASELL